MCQKQSRKQRKGRKRYYSCVTAAEEKHGDCEILGVMQNRVQLKQGRESDPHSCPFHPLSPHVSPCPAGLVDIFGYLGMLDNWVWWCKSLGTGPRQTPHESQCPCALLHYLCSHTRAHPLLFLPRKDKFEQKFIMVWTILQIISSYGLASISVILKNTGGKITWLYALQGS